ncbi:MAG: hypothetical protein GX443_04985 [Deltaproteobacteria bacterium]|nr:hypothetical protein [Deltaproteobacteria bacterium]
MNQWIRVVTVLAVLLGMMGTPAFGGYECSPGCVPSTYPCAEDCYEEDSPPGEFIIADVLILRPLGLISMAVGLTGAALAMPWGCSSCTTHRVRKELLEEPWNYTFARPLGEETFDRDRRY